jgi:flavin reductase (DIM6/NTAB) family NADH-FMN oxidoreductase RutF
MRMDWKDPDMFEAGNHGNKPFAVRVPALVVTRDGKDRLNFLTAMWFTLTGFEPSRMIVAIQKKTLTYDLLLERGEFVMSAPSDEMMEVVVFAGYISGHDVDKWQAAGLTAVRPSKISVPLIGEAIGNVEYRVVQQIPFDEEMDLFVGEVLATHIRKGLRKASSIVRIRIRCSIWARSTALTANRSANSMLILQGSNPPTTSRRS